MAHLVLIWLVPLYALVYQVSQGTSVKLTLMIAFLEFALMKPLALMKLKDTLVTVHLASLENTVKQI
jgi:hypothetical protein